MRVIVAGGRHFQDYGLLTVKLNSILSATPKAEIEIVSGGAPGADSLGAKYAKENNIPYRYFEANWQAHGKAAGPIRNEEMAKYATHCVCFWDGESKGTKSMIELAGQYKLQLRIILYS